MKTYSRDISQKHRILLQFVSFGNTVQQQFQCKLSLTNKKVSIEGKVSSISSAISLLNYLLSFQISQQNSNSTNIHSQFEYFRGLSNLKVKELKKKYNIILIPEFALKQLSYNTIDNNFNKMLVASSEVKNIPLFMQQYKKVNLIENISQKKPKTYDGFEIIKDHEKYYALKLEGVLKDLQFSFNNQSIYILKQHFQKYKAIEQQYVLQKIQSNFQQWKLIRNIKGNFIHQIQMIQGLNQDINYQMIRRQIVFFLRHKSHPTAMKYLQKCGCSFKSQSKKRRVVFQNQGMSEVTVNYFLSQLKLLLTSLGVKVIQQPNMDYIILMYISSKNLNQQIFTKFTQIRLQSNSKYRYKITKDIYSCLKRSFYKSKFNKLTQQFKFSWNLLNVMDSFVLQISNFLGNILELQNNITKLIRQMTLYQYIITLSNKDLYEKVVQYSLPLKLKKLKQSKQQSNDSLLIYRVQGIIVNQQDLKAIDLDLNELITKFQISYKAVKRNNIVFKQFILQKNQSQYEQLQGFSIIENKQIDDNESTMRSLNHHLQIDKSISDF